VEVKIGVQYATRELVLESAQSPEEIEEAISAAIRSEMGLLTLQDEKGRRVLVPVSKLAYIEVAEPEQRRVGFGAM
jgi:3-hydroxyacyl-CoA dehydrogenase